MTINSCFNSTYPCSFIKACAGNDDVSHGHVIHRLLRLRDTALVLQAVQHHQWTHNSTSELWNK